MAEQKRKQTVNQKKKYLRSPLVLLILAGGLIVVLFYLLDGSEKFRFESAQNRSIWNISSTEIPLCEDMECQQWSTLRRRLVVKVSVYAKTDPDQKNTLAQLVKKNEKLLQENIRKAISAVEPWELRDPELKVVTRNIKTGAEKIVGPNYIKKILIPKWSVSVIHS